MSNWLTRLSWAVMILWLAHTVYIFYICDGSKVLFTELTVECIKDD